jgi:hypothetical protein
MSATNLRGLAVVTLQKSAQPCLALDIGRLNLLLSHAKARYNAASVLAAYLKAIFERLHKAWMKPVTPQDML